MMATHGALQLLGAAGHPTSFSTKPSQRPRRSLFLLTLLSSVTSCPSCRTERSTSSPSTPSALSRYVHSPALSLGVLAPPRRDYRQLPRYRLFFSTWRRPNALCRQTKLSIADLIVNCRSMQLSRPTLAILAPLWAWPRWPTSCSTSS